MATADEQSASPVSAPKPLSAELEALKGVVDALLDELRRGSGDREKRRQVEEWMKALADKYPEFGIDAGLRAYYLAEAERLREEFGRVTDLGDKLTIGRTVEAYLDKAGELSRRERG
ncbi:MAG: hypothetical protein HYU52_17420 [Acidobacteria bacterium]|nr:hypothetical protein [Acidobacteriota bacterium]